MVAPTITLHNLDCLPAMREMGDNQFDLAIVDVQYGIERFKNNAPSRLGKYGDIGKANDERPTPEYFAELFRVSQNQIIWGYNHLSDLLPTTKEFIFWHKHQPVISYSDGELAWTSFGKTAKVFDYPYFGTHGSDNTRIHPTQKPVALYKWLLRNYAKEGDTILDTHGGSMSLAIACHDYGFDLTCYELDEEYFNAAVKRLNDHRSQLRLEL